MFGIDVIDLSLQFQDLLSLDGDVCGLTLDTQCHSVKQCPLQAGNVCVLNFQTWARPARLFSDQSSKDPSGPPYPGAPWRLVNHDACVWQRMPHAWRSCCQEQAAHAGCLANTPGGDGIEDVLHGVVNGQACCHHTAWGWRREFKNGVHWLLFNHRLNCNNVHCTISLSIFSLFHVLPGLLIYMWMGLLLLSDCRKSSCAITRLATESSI